MSATSALLLREYRLALRKPGEAALPLLFALLVVCLFPLALGPDAGSLKNLAPGLLCLAALLTQFLGFERLFEGDAESGALDVVALSNAPLFYYALVRTGGRWLLQAAPLVAAAPLLALMLHAETDRLPAIMIALLLSTLCISLSGSAISALLLGAKKGGFLLPLLLAPLAAPVLIFATTLAASGFDAGEGIQAALFLGSLFFLHLVVCPLLCAAALRAYVEAS